MKYRIIELLQCPTHPDAMLRVTSAYISEIFPCAIDLHTPYCRAGCGFLGNWFTEIPQNLPHSHRIDCRRCLGMEIETASLNCPECGCDIRVESGVIAINENNDEAVNASPEAPLPAKTGSLILKMLDLQQGELAIVLTQLAEETNRKWSETSVESLYIETDREQLFSHRAKACADGKGFVHYIAGPFDIGYIRPALFDAIVSMYPSDRWRDREKSLETLPSLLRPSGRILFVISNGKSGNRAALKKFTESLPEAYARFKTKIVTAGEYQLVLLTPEKYSLKKPVVPESAK